MKEERRKPLMLMAIIGLALLMAIPVFAVSSASTGLSHETGVTLYVNGYSVNSATLAGLPSDLMIDHYQYGKGHYILVFDRPVTREMKSAVEQAGAKIIGPLGRDQFIVEISDSDLAKVKAVPHVADVTIDQPAFRLSRMLDHATGPVNVKILAFPGYEGGVAAALAKMSGKNLWITSITPKGAIAIQEIPFLHTQYGMVKATVDSSMLDQVAKINGVAYVEMDHPNWVFNDQSHSQTQHTHNDTTSVGAPDTLAAGQANGGTTPVWNAGIYGEGIVIGETDTAVGLHHDMFRDLTNPLHLDDLHTNSSHPDVYMPDQRKVIMYATYGAADYDHNFSADSPDHGSHVAGTILGYDNPTGNTSAYDGMAPGAKLSFGDIDKPEGGNTQNNNDYLNIPSNFQEMWDPLMTDKVGNLSIVRICSHSWGGHYQDSNGNIKEQDSYDEENAQIDQYQWENDKIFPWAAGNEGNNQHTIGVQAESKNTVTVAAADRTDKMASFSSVGPTFDNRLKPDVTAAGTSINSAAADKGDDQYAAIDGTSMATPCVAGTIGLIQEYFEKGYYPSGSKVSANGFEPSAALMKAEIINGAEEMTDSSATNDPYNGDDGYPSVDQGWGFINVDKSLYLGSSDPIKVRVWDNHYGASTGDNITLNFDVTDTSVRLAVTLVWTDPPAAAGASTALINDLDLTVISPNGDEYKGNVFKGTQPGHSVTGGDYDRLNNVEEVKLFNGYGLTTGVWQVKITGHDIPVDPQPFALVVSGGLNLDAGIVYLDNKVYSQKATAHITVEDGDGGSGVNVTVTSKLTGDSETVYCPGGSGKYLGNITFTLDDTTQDDGVLSVKDGDLVTVTYNDGSFTSNATARIDAKGPVISNVKLITKTNVMAKIGFDTDESAVGAIRYGTDPDNLGNQTDFTKEYSTSPEVVVNGLEEKTLYYYDVLAKDKANHTTIDDNGGDHYKFTTDAQGDVLQIISDKAGFDVNQMIAEYKDAYEDTGWSYNFWFAWDQGLPDLATLQKYKVVSWQVGIEHYPPFDANERALVKNYLDNGGRMWVNSHDVAWDFGDSSNGVDYSAETHGWLLSEMKEDWKQDKDITQINGTSADEISGDYYSNPIDYDRYRDGGSGDDIKSNNAGGTTTYAWYDKTNGDNCGVKWVSSADNGTSGTGVWGGTPSRIVVDNFEWSAFVNRSIVHSDIRSDVLNKTLSWLVEHRHPDVTVTNPSAGDTITADSIDIEWTRTLYGGANVSQTKIYYSDNGGDAWYLIDTLGDVTSYTWDISSISNGNNYNIKVEVIDDSNGQLSGYGLSGVFSISRAGGDNEGPIVKAGTLTAEPIPAEYNKTIWFNATVDDSNKGNSSIYAAEFFVDSTGSDGSGTAMNPVDGSFNSPTEQITWNGTCTWVRGDHVLYVHAQDSAGNWGPFSNVSFHVNGPTPVVVYADSGWNLVSFPWVSTPTSITDLLNGWSWTQAMVYDNHNKMWYTYDAGRDAKFNVAFPKIDNTMGVWIKVSGHSTLSGLGSGTTSTYLYKGWNLVGYPNGVNHTVSDALNGLPYDYVQTYDNSTDTIISLADTDNMVPGIGYWVYTSSNCWWNVTWESNNS